MAFLLRALVTLIVIGNVSAHAEIVFEGYYKVTSNESQIGFFVQRYEVDPKTKNFKSTYFISTQVGSTRASESLKAESTKDFAPVSFQYTMTDGSASKTIDATFNGDVMTANVTEGNKSNTVNRKLRKGTFLSSFLGYMILSKGMKESTTYDYFALAEEDAGTHSGKAIVQNKTTFNGIPAFRLENRFKDATFTSLVSETGEVLMTSSPTVSLKTELVARRELAVSNTKPFEKPLKLLFGKVPDGTRNGLNRAAATAQPKPASTPAPPSTPPPAQKPPSPKQGN